MDIEEMRKLKAQLHYTNEMIAERSGVPLPTVQKIFAGVTTAPRYHTRKALEAVFERANRSRYTPYLGEQGSFQVRESNVAYDLFGTGNPETTDTTYPFAGTFERNAEGLLIHPRYRIPIRRQGEYTTEDLALIPDDVRVELIDGVIYDLAAPTYIHQIIIGTVYTLMNNFAMQHEDACLPLLSPVDVKLDRDNKTQVEPDLLVICGGDGETQVDEWISGPPDFIMEVLSPSTRRVDIIIKLNKYMFSGVREYWIVDPDARTVDVYDFEHDNLNQRYTFDDTVPVAISGGALSIDFHIVQRELVKGERIKRVRSTLIR